MGGQGGQTKRAMNTLPEQTALEAFLRGFSTTRSFTKPYDVTQLNDSLWMLADRARGKLPGRSTEFVTTCAEPAGVLEAIDRQDVGRHALCVLVPSADELPATVAGYKDRGYRYHGREPLFVLDLGNRVACGDYPTRRVVTAADAEAVRTAARSRQILPAHLVEADSVCRLYAAFEGDAAIGWVRSIRTHPECAWVASMFVAREHRRKGIGRSLLTAMLEDDARFGVRWSVLLASLTGALLYPHLGYEERGLLLVFTPARSK
jgi:GNAT superfamily N-acetyltransferase